MSHEYLNKVRQQVGTVASPTALDSAATISGDGFVYGVRADINRIGFVVTTAYTAPVSGALTMTLSLADPVNASPTSFAVVSFGSATYAVGDVVWADVIVPVAQTTGDDALANNPRLMPTSQIDVAPAGPMTILPGQALEIAVTNAAQAGDGVVFIERIEHDEPVAFINQAGNVFVNP